MLNLKTKVMNKKKLKIVLSSAILISGSLGVNINMPQKYLSNIMLANIEALADHSSEQGSFKAGYEASTYQVYFEGYGYTTIPCCRYNGNKYSGCSAIDICPN